MRKRWKANIGVYERGEHKTTVVNYWLVYPVSNSFVIISSYLLTAVNILNNYLITTVLKCYKILNI